ncbi:MAG: hypothetical protein C0448_14440 [Sphingobacteriaceae bacterium]|nr:hypothetical protein [Sphingobacteriaceae bacterium]
MFWERWIPKSFLIKSSICGVECVFNESGVSFFYSIIQTNKNKVVILEQGKLHHLEGLIGLLKKKKLPLILSFTGKGIIIKRIIFSENDSLKFNDLLKQHLPAIPYDEFYIQFYKNNVGLGHFSFCRKEQVNDLLSYFKKENIEIVNVFISPLVCNSLSHIISNYNKFVTNTNQLEILDGHIESVDSITSDEYPNLMVAELDVAPSFVVSFASAFSYLTQQINFITDDFEISILPKNHLEKLKVRFLLMVLVSIVFILAAFNSVMFFQKYQDNSSIEVELNLYESKNNQITMLLDNYQKKKDLIEQAGIFDNTKMSIYADKIAKSLPNEILLKELYFNPEDGDANEDSLANFIEKQIIIKGNCNKSLILNDWINVLKSQSFIQKVNLETFIYNSESYLPNFVLKIDTK